MNEVTKKITSDYKPFMGIICYKEEGENSFYMERRNIENGRFCEGVPMEKELFTKIVKAISAHDDTFDIGMYGAIPQNLLYCDQRFGRNKMVWWRGKEKRMMLFSESAGIPDGMMSVPGLVYVAEGERLSVYAFKGKKPTNVLYRAPFLNVDAEHVCLGNARITYPTERTYENIMTYWENLFWRSEFVHILGENPIKGNLTTITKHCIETGEVFPENQLKKLKDKTLKTLMK